MKKQNRRNNMILDLPRNTKFDKLRFAIGKRVTDLSSIFGCRSKHLIVCGFPRGGTSLIYNMLSTVISHKFRFTEFEKYFMYQIHKVGSIATKAPLDIMYLQFIDELNVLDKELIILVMIRDIREVITSRHPMLPSQYFIGYDCSYWPSNGFSDWKCVAPGVLEISKAIKDARERSDVMIIKYEDLASDPDKIQKDISRKYELHFNGLFGRYNEKKHLLPYRYSGRFKARDLSLVLEGESVKQRTKRWMNPEHRERIVEQFESCPELFDLLVEYGYEKDDMWFNDLVVNSG